MRGTPQAHLLVGCVSISTIRPTTCLWRSLSISSHCFVHLIFPQLPMLSDHWFCGKTGVWFNLIIFLWSFSCTIFELNFLCLNSLSHFKTWSLASCEEGCTISWASRSESWVSAADCRMQLDDWICWLLWQHPGLSRNTAMSALQCICSCQSRCLWQLWRECVPVP